MTATHKYLKVSPRGFANEFTVLRVPVDKVAEAEAKFAGLEDNDGNSSWVSGPFAPGSLVDWADRAYVGL